MSDNHLEKELWEKFTFEGFVMVSLYALLFFLMVLSVWIEISGCLFKNNSIWENLGLGYLIMWILCFLFFCLIPKLNYEMEIRGRLNRLKNRKTWKRNKKQIEQIVEKDIKNKKPRKRYKKSHKP